MVCKRNQQVSLVVFLLALGWCIASIYLPWFHTRHRGYYTNLFCHLHGPREHVLHNIVHGSSMHPIVICDFLDHFSDYLIGSQSIIELFLTHWIFVRSRGGDRPIPRPPWLRGCCHCPCTFSRCPCLWKLAPCPWNLVLEKSLFYPFSFKGQKPVQLMLKSVSITGIFCRDICC